ncbi:hypothetical protein [Leptospira inadai]|uniref:Uncharacterized protein n=1 Tax=Leptospira inadai serovar Lyme TaxID=293084 RepID=A0ABX4YM20_9LEPT|nr:hypothetical protein [Leptospira inadai]PNV76200.1 hypothetical protein BES34_004120 [Leptospira inadai serovar Lyme]
METSTTEIDKNPLNHDGLSEKLTQLRSKLYQKAKAMRYSLLKEPNAGNLHVRFVEGDGSLTDFHLYSTPPEKKGCKAFIIF